MLDTWCPTFVQCMEVPLVLLVTTRSNSSNVEASVGDVMAKSKWNWVEVKIILAHY